MTNEPSILRAADDTQSALMFEAPVELQAAEGENKLPRFKITAYTGNVMNAGGFYHPIIVDLSGLKASRGKLPILLDHDPSRLVGQADKIEIDPSGVTLSGAITGNDADTQKVVTHAKNGFEWQASIGASVDRREFVEAGKSAKVNGKEVHGPIIIARAATLKETSFVVIGADPDTAAAIAARHQHSNPAGSAATKEQDMKFNEWLKAKGFDPATVTDAQKVSLQAMYDAEQKSAKGGEADAGDSGKQPVLSASAKTLKAKLDAERAETARLAEIDRITMDYVKAHPGQIDAIEAAATRAIEQNLSAQQLELSLLRDCRPQAPNARIGRSSREPDASTITAAICMAGQLNDIEKKFKPEVLEAAHQQWPHGLGLEQAILLFARRNGFGGTTTKGVLEAALRAAFHRNAADIQASGFSTISLPGILGAVANKYLLEGYSGVEQTWREIATIRPVQDFKTVTGYRMTGAFQFEKVGPDGELKHGAVGEDTYTNKAETYGKLFAITRTDIINDDLGALTAVPRRIGRGGALKLNEVFWTEWLENAGNFWHTSNNNIITGGGTVLGAAGLQAAVTKFAKLVDSDGKPLATMPDRLLVPPEIKVTADQLYMSTFVNTGGAATTERVPNANTFQNKYRPIQSTYLSNTAIAGSSTTAFWLLGNPADISAIEVVFLNGVQQPTVESADADFNVLGIQMRGYWDFGVNKQDPRAGVKSAGA